jgi:hypothetical protein
MRRTACSESLERMEVTRSAVGGDWLDPGYYEWYLLFVMSCCEYMLALSLVLPKVLSIQ